MIRLIVATLLTVLVFAQSAWAQSPTIQTHPELGALFDEISTSGTFVALHVQTNQAHVYNPDRAAQSFPPASTFKILNSLIALETGVVSDTDTHILRWDGETRPNAAWNKDHTLRSAFAVSALPAYRQIARDVGLARMTSYLDAVSYGRGTIDAEILDIFWVLPNYTTTAWQQVDFLKRLYLNDLPFSQPVMEAVKNIAVVERRDRYVLSGKTGWTTVIEPGLGWFVGWLEREDGAHVFALNMDMHDGVHADARILLAKKSLSGLDLYPLNP